MIKTICRAIVTVEDLPYLAVHQDGHPDSFGRNLYEAALKGGSFVEAAREHVIVAVVSRLLTRMNLGRLAYLAKKHQMDGDLIEKGYRSAMPPDAQDQLLVNIKAYADRAEHQYDLREDGVYWRPLSGYWPESAEHAGEFKKLGWVMLEQLKRQRTLRPRLGCGAVTNEGEVSPIGGHHIQQQIQNSR